MGVTGQTMREALTAARALGRQMRSLDDLAAGADGALRQAPPGLTAAGAASFLATTAQESDYYRTTVEYGRGQRYAPYIGRGFVQCTWRENYRAFGAWCRDHGLVDDPGTFEKSPAALGDYRWAWLTAVWYFEVNRLWDWANAGDHLRVSQAVNGGRGRAGTGFVPNHWAERRAMFEAFTRAGAVLLPDGIPTRQPGPPGPDNITELREGDTGPAVLRLQQWLNRNFPAYDDTPLDLAPQRYGPATIRVVAEFQRRSGIVGGDGRNLGRQTRQKLWDAGYRP